MIDVKIIKKAKQGHVSVGGGIATAGNNYTTGIQQTLADVLNFNAGLTRLLKPYDANNQPLTWAQATDPDGDGGIKAKTLRAAVTFASVGDIVAYENGNLSGGTGGGGLDITALEDYLTTNGYATQDWVSAHFNDYVLTKAAVEAVLTGNITTHTHNQYLTEHQSLANYMTRGEIGDTYQTKSTALSFSAAEGYVAARFADNTLCAAAVDKYIEFWCNSGWYNFEIGSLTAHGAVTATQFIRTGGTASQFLKADGSVDSNSYLLSSAYTASDILTKIKTVDGAGSGLDADMLDGYQALNFLRNRDRVSTADVYMDVNEVPANSVQHDYRWDNAPFIGNNIASILDLSYSPDWRTQLFVRHLAKTNILVRSRHNGTKWGDWRALAFTDSNVASATRLQTARTINGTAFDGTAAITTAKWGTARNLTIGNTAKSVDGSSAMAWSLAEIGALGVNANAVSASKLQTAHTLWGQSFDGTDNVAGTLSGVEDILFNVNARLNATDNAFRFFTKTGGAQGIQAGNLLISHSFADANKVPENGIYSRDGLVTDGTIKIGGGTITWDAGNNAFMFSHTVASQGDMVAFQNGNLSGGTGGGGLDITALESYLTTNGYATQSWVSAHFNDYVLTKAAVEAVLTGNITSHTHSQYLTEHQSLANYYTKAESDGKYLLSSAYTAANILTKLKTVDGSGSGLDADMLDGYQETSFFRTHRGGIPTAYIDLTTYTSGATDYANYESGTYNIRRTGYSELFANLALNAGSTSALQFKTSYDDKAALYFRKACDSNRITGPWRIILTELNVGAFALTPSNYAATLDARYYTESEINAMLTNGSVTKVGTATIGSAAHPIYLNAGTPTACGYSFGNATGNAPLNNGTLNVSLNADMLDGVHGKGYMYHSAYCFENGCLVRLKLEHNHDYMLTVHIRGNSYGALRPIDTWVQFYYYKTTGTLIYTAALHIGYDFGNINVFCYDGHIYLWFKQTSAYQSFSVYAECTNEYYVGNLVENITNAAMPTEGVTRLVTITPKQSALTTDNVASATKLQTARTINGTAFDGTAAITTAKWGTARNLTIGNTAKSVDGSGNVAWSLAEIGALGVNANAVSASKLATPHTLWGQSFDGTDNVAGTLSGVEEILFNVNARLNATDNAFRFLTKTGGAQGIQAGNLLISDLFSDANKVPEKGIYSKDGLVTDGSIKIGGGTITWDEATNSFIFSHTVASQGDVVAFKQ